MDTIAILAFPSPNPDSGCFFDNPLCDHSIFNHLPTRDEYGYHNFCSQCNTVCQSVAHLEHSNGIEEGKSRHSTDITEGDEEDTSALMILKVTDITIHARTEVSNWNDLCVIDRMF